MAIATISSTVDRLLASQKPLRTWSLVITFFGDSIVPRGGEVWLGTLTQVMMGLGIDDQAVRAAVSRLTKDGWLARERLGRNSYYRLLEIGNREFAIATDRIYGKGAGAFDGSVGVVTGKAAVPASAKQATGTNSGELLAKLGWGRMAANVYCAFGRVDLPETIRKDFIRIDGSIMPGDATDLIARSWDLKDIEAAYRDFIAGFEAFRMSMTNPLDPFDALMARTLLIHSFRRIVLRDPMLPDDLMSKTWPGRPARQLAASLYRILSPEAEQWLDENAVCSAGKLPALRDDAKQRFV